MRPRPCLLVAIALVAQGCNDTRPPAPSPARDAETEATAPRGASSGAPSASRGSTPAGSPPASGRTPTAASPSSAPAPEGPCPPGHACDYAAYAAPTRPTVTRILVQKQRHQLHLVAGDTIVRSYGVALGSGGLGQKLYEGDKVTPIGDYEITGRYPSKWHTYLAISYPNAADVARHAEAKARGDVPEGRGPGSAIAIHGHRRDQPARQHKAFDWTLGCVSLDNDEIDEVASAAPVGTRVTIEP